MQLITITLIFHDGYKDWNVSRVKTVQVEGPFNKETCLKAFNKAEGEDCDSLEDATGGEGVQKENVITCMGEENGITFVGS